LVNTAEWRNINSLTSDGTSRSDTGGIFTGTSVDDSIYNNLDWVLVGQEVDDVKSVLNNSDSLHLLAVVSAVHHQRVGETLDDWALRLSEAFLVVSASSVG